MSVLSRLRVTGKTGASIMWAAMGEPSCVAAVEKAIEASVLEEAMTLLEQAIAEEGWGALAGKPWEWAYHPAGNRVSEKDYRRAIQRLRDRADRLHSEANSEMMWGRILRRQHYKEILEELEKRGVRG